MKEVNKRRISSAAIMSVLATMNVFTHENDKEARKDEILKEYELIKQKKSQLSSNERAVIERNALKILGVDHNEN